MTHPLAVEHQHFPDPHHETYHRNIFGFWIYLMSDCILFASLFATYAVLHKQTFGGPSAKELFHLPYVLGETFLLLISSFTSGLGMLAAHQNKKNRVLFWFVISFLLGLGFVAMEGIEFSGMVQEGNSWQTSAFLSSYFTLVGTHGIHVSVGLLWMIVVIGQIIARDLTVHTLRRLSCLSLFWHFLDLVWIFIFTIVYLMGAAQI